MNSLAYKEEYREEMINGIYGAINLREVYLMI